MMKSNPNDNVPLLTQNYLISKVLFKLAPEDPFNEFKKYQTLQGCMYEGVDYKNFKYYHVEFEYIDEKSVHDARRELADMVKLDKKEDSKLLLVKVNWEVYMNPKTFDVIFNHKNWKMVFCGQWINFEIEDK